MKENDRTRFEACKPDHISLGQALDFCLERLYEDPKHSLSEDIWRDCTYSEIIGTLLLAKDMNDGKVVKLKKRKRKQ
jgi:hypothetical protein